MTTEELKAHRRAICEALIEGKQCQVMGQYKVRPDGSWFYDKPDEWFSCDATTVAHWLFDSDDIAARVRIKPEPRKVWLRWPKNRNSPCPSVCVRNILTAKESLDKAYNWQLVEEPE